MTKPMNTAVPHAISKADIEYQQKALGEVSRTFALTIPLLPEKLEQAVGNAYLLCRIADTIEDDEALSNDDKAQFSRQLIDLVNGADGSDSYAAKLAQQLGNNTPEGERDLVANTGQVLDITRQLSSGQVEAINTCVSSMATGMPEFQQNLSASGLPDMATLNSYCYYVAGVVGEMLTKLFCDYSEKIAHRREALTKLAFSFGQGLQLTNILKDIWVDQKRGVCWLPQDLFSRYGYDLNDLKEMNANPSLTAGMQHLIGVTRHHLGSALDYALTIPRQEKEIRQFLVFPLLLALLTLRKIHNNSADPDGSSIKISRRSVMLSALFVRFGAHHDRTLKQLVKILTRGLPNVPPSALRTV